MLIEFFLIFILGTCVGSFLNVFIDRSIAGESFIKGKSRCDRCRKNIAWYDLIPLISFVSLKAKCRYCKSHLSFYYPLTELATGILFVSTVLFVLNNFQTNLLPSLFFYLFIVSSLIAVFFADLKYGIIPDKVVFPAAFLTIFYQIFFSKELLTTSLLSCFVTFIFFLILIIITRGRGMGLGDLKFSVLMGLLLGFPGIVVGLYLAFLTGAVVGVILILWRKKKLRGSTIPFGPFLVLGTILSLFYSEFFIKLILLQLF